MVGEYDCVQLLAQPRSFIQQLLNKHNRITEANKHQNVPLEAILPFIFRKQTHLLHRNTYGVFCLSSRCIVVAML